MIEWILFVGLMRDAPIAVLDQRYPTFEACTEAGARWETEARAWATRSGLPHTAFWMCGESAYARQELAL